MKSKTYYVTLNDMIDCWLAENPLQMTSFGESLDPAALDVIEPDGGEGWVVAIPLIAVGVAVIAAIFVIRVFTLRARVKNGKALQVKKSANKKKKKSARR